jgi:hypothetical protein
MAVTQSLPSDGGHRAEVTSPLLPPAAAARCHSLMNLLIADGPSHACDMMMKAAQSGVHMHTSRCLQQLFGLIHFEKNEFK